ncbi:MAG: S8 family peptidase [Lysobacteraceae bacterium]
MNRSSKTLAAAIGLAVLGATGVAAAEAELRFAKQPVEGQYIVVLKDEAALLATESAAANANIPEIATVARSMSRQHGLDVRMTYSHALRGFVVRANDRALARLLADPRVDFVEEDGVVSIGAVQNNPTWGLDRIDQRQLPLDSRYEYLTTAANVHTYIIDTGVRRTHSDFGGRTSAGYTAINDGRGSDDCNGHGTHVAGTVAGATWGVAKAARIHGVRVLGCNGSGTNSGVVAGMDWVTANHIKPAVANMSLGGGANTATDSAVTRMRNAGVTVVVAAGNDNGNACNYSPARSSAAITVGSTQSNDARSGFSNFGTCVDIFAPGSNIRSAWHTSNTAANTISGTSMAAPHVAGVAALYLANNPNATPAQVEQAIYSNATTGRVSNPGSGSPNRLVYSLFGGGGGTPDPDPDPDPTPGELSNGVPVTGLSGAQGSEQRFTFPVPSGSSNLRIAISGGTGDADLYVRRGAPPTTSTYDCRPYLNGNNEECTAASPQGGTYHIMLRGYRAYSGVTLVGSYQGGSSAPCTNCDRYTGSLSGTGNAQVQPNGNYYQAGAGNHSGWLRGPSNADFDLELYRWSGFSWQRVARSASSDSNEQISYNGTSGFYYWRVVSASGGGNYELFLRTP